MKKAWLALSLLFAIVCAGSAAAPASALVSYYNCVDKPSGLWCDGRANGSFDGLNSWDYNEGWNPGGGTIWVCERVYRPATGNWLNPDVCAGNFAGYYYGDVQCSCYEAEAQHWAGSSRNINGYADSNF